MFFQILLLIILTAVNAFFASAEMAMVSMDKSKIAVLAENGNLKAKKLVTISKNPNTFLSTIQVGITLAGFFSSASAATGLSSSFGIWLTSIGVPFGRQIALIVVTLLLSYFILVFGELFPKRIALLHADTIALKTVQPITIIGKVTAPFVTILTLSINGLLRLFNVKAREDEDILTEEKIRFIIHRGAVEGAIKPIEEERIHKIFAFDDEIAKNVMLPKEKVFMIDCHTLTPLSIKAMIQQKHSRIPVYDTSKDNIIGILLLKDVFEAVKNNEFMTNIDIQDLLQEPVFVNESTPINTLFLQLQKTKKHMVFVRDTQYNFLGIVTIEDLIEEVFGEIEDEYDA